MIICCLLFSLNAAAQKQDIDSVSTQGSKSSLMDKLRQVQQYLDDKAKKKVDPHYIEVPEKPWRVILRYKENMVDVDYSMFRLNLDLRLGIAYNWRNCFIGAQAQYNNFNYKNDHCKVNIYDAYARVSFGVRL